MNQRKNPLWQGHDPKRLLDRQVGQPLPHEPRVAQPKMAMASQTKQPPVAPPACLPRPVPKVLQTKTAGLRQSQTGQPPRQPIAPPVYRPEAKKVAQPRMAAQGQKPKPSITTQGSRPRPAPKSPQASASSPGNTIQRRLTINGVSVSVETINGHMREIREHTSEPLRGRGINPDALDWNYIHAELVKLASHQLLFSYERTSAAIAHIIQAGGADNIIANAHAAHIFQNALPDAAIDNIMQHLGPLGVSSLSIASRGTARLFGGLVPSLNAQKANTFKGSRLANSLREATAYALLRKHFAGVRLWDSLTKEQRAAFKIGGFTPDLVIGDRLADVFNVSMDHRMPADRRVQKALESVVSNSSEKFGHYGANAIAIAMIPDVLTPEQYKELCSLIEAKIKPGPNQSLCLVYRGTIKIYGKSIS